MGHGILNRVFSHRPVVCQIEGEVVSGCLVALEELVELNPQPVTACVFDFGHVDVRRGGSAHLMRWLIGAIPKWYSTQCQTWQLARVEKSKPVHPGMLGSATTRRRCSSPLKLCCQNVNRTLPLLITAARSASVAANVEDRSYERTGHDWIFLAAQRVPG